MFEIRHRINNNLFYLKKSDCQENGQNLTNVIPENVAVYVGAAVRLNCSNTEMVSWYFKSPSSGTSKMITFNGKETTGNFASRYTLDTSVKERFDLIINRAQSTHAGEYVCDKRDIRAVVQLIVLGK